MQLKEGNPICFGPDGSLYVGDESRIRKIDPNGIITTIAGTDQSGHSGDGGLAINAQINEPEGMAVSNGELYFSYTDLTMAGTLERLILPQGSSPRLRVMVMDSQGMGVLR